LTVVVALNLYETVSLDLSGQSMSAQVPGDSLGKHCENYLGKDQDPLRLKRVAVWGKNGGKIE